MSRQGGFYDDRQERSGGGNRSYGGSGGFGGGGGGGGGGYRGQDYSSTDDHEKTEFDVDQNNVGRIIGRQGSKIKELQNSSGCYIKIFSDQAENGKVKVLLSGDYESREMAKEMIKELDRPYDPSERRGGGGGGGGGGGSYGNRGRDYGRGDRGGAMVCYQCGGEGHFARDCQNAEY